MTAAEHRQAIESTRMEDGRLPAFAWPGGYLILYLMADGETLCPACANRENGSLATTDPAVADGDKQWLVVAQDVHYEGPPETCAHCGAMVGSAYGDPLAGAPGGDAETA